MKAQDLVLNHLNKINTGQLIVELPNGAEQRFGDRSEPVRIIVRNEAFFSKLLYGGSIGLGEAWTDGDWDSPHLTKILELFIHNLQPLEQSGLGSNLLKRSINFMQHCRNRNSVRGSKRNIHAHYDLSNEFFELFLDPETMMYSSALFTSPNEPLSTAQLNKIHCLIDLADIQPQHHILEIGCGWGGFAIEAARRTGCRVTGITISEEQYSYARNRVEAAGLSDRIDIKRCDYRKLQGAFDRIISIEMLEAVGHAYYGTYFATCDQLLKPGGRMVLQVITIPDQRFKSYRRNPDWIQKHIFPGGMLPSITELAKAITTSSSLTINHLHNFGPDYAETLRRWNQMFQSKTNELESLGFDATFRRKWSYYFSYCEAGFSTRFTNNLHLVLIRSNEIST